jgi:hypothetical protein
MKFNTQTFSDEIIYSDSLLLNSREFNLINMTNCERRDSLNYRLKRLNIRSTKLNKFDKYEIDLEDYVRSI